MKFILKLSWLIFVGFTFLSPLPIFASEQFLTKFDITYQIASSGTATAIHQISLVNRFSDVYATEYALEIGSTRLGAISVTSDSNPIAFNTTPTDNTTIINMKFANPAVGKGKSQDFTVTYQDPDVSSLKGQVLEVNIPKLNDIESIEDIQVNIQVPKEFSLPNITQPEQYYLESTDQYHILSFTKNQINTGITALFGDKQVFDFTLNYHLENPTNSNGLYQVALPPDTGFQKINYSLIDPPPQSINVDPDGNWIATYILKPKQKSDVVAQGQATIFLTPQPYLLLNKPTDKAYTDPQPYWEVDSPIVQSTAKKLTTAKEIYDYTIEKLSYDYTRIDSSQTKRLGALHALENPQSAICQEFTDTFIALARASGIPAREHNGYALTNNSKLRPLSLVQDVLHSWPEYYDFEINQWLPVDPTWGDTTGGVDYFHLFDLNHITFVIHGISSTQPLAAGYYKFQDTASKDILVEFAQAIITIQPDYSVSHESSPITVFGIPSTATYTIHNNTGSAFYNQSVTLQSDVLKFTPSTYNLEYILPFSTQSTKIKLSNIPILSTADIQSQITINGQTYQDDINLFKDQPEWILVALAISLVSVTILVAYGSWSLLVSRFKR